MSKWKEIESYVDSKSMHESKFNINKKQAQLILDLKKDELKKMRFLAMLDIDKDELKQLAKKDPTIVKAIGKQGGSFRTSLVRKRANEEVKEDAPTNSVASGGVDMNPTGMSIKKKKELDARTKEYKLHRRKLKMQREKRMNKKKILKGSFTKGIKESMNNFAREKFITEVFSSGMMDKLKKSYEPLRGKKISPSAGDKLMKIMDKVDKNKNALIQLFKADIPFVSQLAATRLISKHNMKGKDINKLK